ncbi:MAG TPA: ABC transporter permease subunit [Dehalococcoidales bacterium]|nr:ABC transporter permease subunit [Dehalococcoidales bacterium]
MLLVWQVLSMLFSRVIIASPQDTFVALGNLLLKGELWTQFGHSLGRLFIGLGAGSVLGIIMGILAGMNYQLRFFLEPMRWTIVTVPVIILAVLAMLWFGIGSLPVLFLVGLITTPIVYVNTLEGMLAIDSRVLEMARVYKIPSHLKIREIYLPGIGSSIMAGLTNASGIGVRALILAEFMGGRNGIGQSFFKAWSFLDTPALFAWILTAFALMGLVEFGILRPTRDYLMRWKKT